MFDAKELQVAMIRKGLTYEKIAQLLGVAPSTIYRKIKNDGNFNRDEINRLIEILELEHPEDIFFAKELA